MKSKQLMILLAILAAYAAGLWFFTKVSEENNLFEGQAMEHVEDNG